MKAQSLPGEEWLQWLVDKVVSDEVIAVALSGSYARGDAAPYSDIDLVCLTGNTAEPTHRRDELFYRDGYLVSVSFRTADSRFRELERPSSAIFAVLPWRRAYPLLDRDGSLARLQQAARSFHWPPLQSAANCAAAEILLHQVEVVHKILGSLATRDDERAVIYTWEMVQEMTIALALHHGTLIESSNVLFRQVRRSVGETSEWALQHRRATGIDDVTTRNSPIMTRAGAALRLYSASASLLEPILDTVQRGVVTTAVARINAVDDGRAGA